MNGVCVDGSSYCWHLREQHQLPSLRTQHIDALHVYAQGNGHADVQMFGVVYSDRDGTVATVGFIYCSLFY